MDALNSPLPYHLGMAKTTTSILVIEEHPLMRESLRTAISGESDLKVMEPSALDTNTFQLFISKQHDILFLTEKPDIILLALRNPGQDDMQALTDLRKKLQDTPILALTRDEVSGQEEAALQHGAHAVLKKSASREELVHTLRSIKADSFLL